MADLKPQSEKPTRARSSKPKNTDPEAVKTPAKTRSAKPRAAQSGINKHSISPEQRYRMVAEAAYHHAEKRGFVGGDPLNDWLLAEAEVDQMLNG